MIGYTLAEIRHLLVKITQHQPPSPGHARVNWLRHLIAIGAATG